MRARCLQRMHTRADSRLEAVRALSLHCTTYGKSVGGWQSGGRQRPSAATNTHTIMHTFGQTFVATNGFQFGMQSAWQECF